MTIAAIGAIQPSTAGISGISGISGINPIGAQQASSPIGPTGTSFMDALGGALDKLSTQMTTADTLATKVAAGEPVDIHQVMVAMETASLGLQTGLQVRNKMLEAYKEIMSMPL